MSTADLVPVSESGALEADPVEYMALALNRAKGWLSEATSIEEVRHEKAIAVGYESVIREKELAFDAQLAATEIVRRCERRIGELVRAGQREGTVLTRGQTLRRLDPVGVRDLGRPHELMGVGLASDAVSDTYVMADAPPDQFEQAVAEAREEGNLSRANVVRKVKGEQPQRERSEWHHKTRHIDSNRILSTLTQELDALTAGLELMERDGLDPELVAECIPSAKRSISVINSHLRRIA
jgi:hypothetical protein